MVIVPAILAKTELDYQEKLEKIEDSGVFEDGWIQIDLMDNKFVHNQSISPAVIAKFPTNFKIEAQLMVDYPENWIDDLIKAGVNRLVFPVEDNQGIPETIKHVKNHQIEVGLSINPETAVEKLEPFVGTIDTVLVMSVYPGFGGQEFLPESVEKIKRISRLLSKENKFKIGVDGGIDQAVVRDLVEAGVDYLVIGSHLLKGDIDENLEKIWEAIQAV